MDGLRDYYFPLEALWDESGWVRVRVRQQDNAPTVILLSEAPENKSVMLTTMIEFVAYEIWQLEGSPASCIWIEHDPKERILGNEAFHLVTFVQQPATRFFTPSWQPTTKNVVEELLGVEIG